MGRGRRRSPRSGGDGPFNWPVKQVGVSFSPLRRGWSVGGGDIECAAQVLPAQAGMVRPVANRASPAIGSPRSGGDGPGGPWGGHTSGTFSPLRRGWSPALSQLGHRGGVLPAQAGMVPGLCGPAGWMICSPRSGGDGPLINAQILDRCAFSPLRRGWSLRSFLGG